MYHRLYKMAFRDLINNRKKAITAFLAIVIGMISFGTMLFTQELITNELITSYFSINPSSATLNVDIIDEKFIQLTEAFDGIADFEIKAFYQFRGQTKDGDWKTVELFSAESYASLNINKVFFVNGEKTPSKGEMLIERDALSVSGKNIGDTLLVQLPNNEQTELLISGIVNDISIHPATMHNTIYAYVSPETLESMGLSQNRIDIKISGDAYDREQIVNTSNEYMKMLENNGYQIKNIEIEDTPGISMHLEEYETALFLLQMFSIIAFIFSCLIMSSLITSMLSQQIKQIGILKSLGANKFQIIKTYLISISIPIVLFVFISLPISKCIAVLISSPLLRISNITLVHKDISITLSIVFVLFSLLVPLCVAFFSIFRGTSISIREAINDTGTISITGILKVGILKKLFKRPTRLSIRNAFRKKSRLVLNVFTLTISGICFITILTSMLAVQNTLNTNMNSFQYEYRFLTSYSAETLVQESLDSMSNIDDYELWGYTTGKYIKQNDNHDKTYTIMAIPDDSKFIEPDFINGSWLTTSQENSVIVSHMFLNDHPNLTVGDSISFDIGGLQITFLIKGVIKDFSGSNIYINKSYFENYIPLGQRQLVTQVTIDSDLKSRNRQNLIHEVEEELLVRGISILQSETKTNAISILESHHMPTFQTLLIIILMVSIVSGFGLASTTNIQTLERVKEIGIMKSFGASKKQIIKIITAESCFISCFSWVLSAILAPPLIILTIKYFTDKTLEAPIQLSATSIALSYAMWFIIVLIIGKRASTHTAKKASAMLVKECLYHE